jgi:hypothetical protein
MIIDDLCIVEPGLTPDQTAGRARRLRSISNFAVNFLSFVALAGVFLPLNRPRLFDGVDGNYMLTIAKQQFEWGAPMFGLSNNFLQSLGNIWFPLNTPLIPGYAIPELLNSGELNPVVSYAIFAAELFLATFLLGLSLRLRVAVAVLAAWLLPLTTIPLVGPPLLYPILSLTPHIATAMAVTMLVLILFGQIGRRGWAWSCGCASGATLLLSYPVAALPDKLILMVPVLSVFGACLLATAETRRELFAKLAGAAFLLAAAITSGTAAYLVGMVRYSAPAYFSGEFLNDRMSWYYVSILFHRHQRYGGPSVWALGISGAVIAALWGSGLLRRFAIGTLAAAALLIGVGWITVRFDIWQGPSPIYFEFLVWPFYVVYGAVALAFGAGLLARVLRMLTRGLPISLSVMDHNGAQFGGAVIVIALLPWLLVSAARSRVVAQEATWPYPPRQTPIIAALQQEIGVTPGSVFRGRAATFTALSIDRPITWFDLHNLAARSVTEFGNDHRLGGLWYYGIPSLTEYSNLLTPAFYLVTRALLARPGDRQLRSVMTLREIKPRILRMMGVRFLITDASVGYDAHLRLRLPDAAGSALLLYELPGANLGDYSPTEPILVQDARAAVQRLSDGTFDPTRSVLVNAPLPGPFVPSTSARLFVERDGLRVLAKSERTSLLLLPVEFSHCLKLQASASANPQPKLFRANLLQTGVTFERLIDARLIYFTGPFRNSTCRIEDAREMDRLRIHDAVARQ